MLEFFIDDDDGDIVFGFYDGLSGGAKKNIKLISEIFGYHFESVGDESKQFLDLPDFNNDTLIISSEHVNEDIIELSRDKNFNVFIVAIK